MGEITGLVDEKCFYPRDDAAAVEIPLIACITPSKGIPDPLKPKKQPDQHGPNVMNAPLSVTHHLPRRARHVPRFKHFVPACRDFEGSKRTDRSQTE
jgi:hypothetical protein